jgi:D-3-phosphoglycerate dehydrogenase
MTHNHRILIATRSFGSTSTKPYEVLEKASCRLVKADMTQKMTENRLIDLLVDVDGAIVGVVPMTAHVLEHAPKLKVISMHGVGVDHIDVKAATRLGIVIANCPGTNDQAVADLAIGLMISIARGIPLADQELRRQTWGRHNGHELWNKTLGLIGLGRIGRGVAKRARGFDMNVLAYDPYVSAEESKTLNVTMAPFDEVVAQADFLSLHSALTDETRTMIGKTQLAMMKPSAYLINTSRGELIDEKALYDALTEGQIAGAALDAFVDEPPWGNPLLALKNLIVTPHMGAHTQEAIERVGILAAQNVVQTLQMGEPLHRVI